MGSERPQRSPVDHEDVPSCAELCQGMPTLFPTVCQYATATCRHSLLLTHPLSIFRLSFHLQSLYMQEQATAQALMAESLAQALRTQLKAQQEESQTSGQLLQAVFTGLAEACSSSSTSPAYPQGLEPCSLSRQLAAGLPDEAMAQLAVSHVQAILSSNAAQQQQLSELTQQVEQYMAESAAAAEDVQATAQALSQLASVSPESPPALSHAVPSELSQGRRSSDSVARCQVRSLVHLAESVAKAHREQNQDLVCSQAQIEQLTQQLRQATSQVAEGEARLQASSAQGQGFEQQLARTQADLQQVLTLAHLLLLP